MPYYRERKQDRDPSLWVNDSQPRCYQRPLRHQQIARAKQKRYVPDGLGSV